jgi:DNA-binding response OmpR family regulator
MSAASAPAVERRFVAASIPRMRVLLVEDDADLATSVAQAIREAGWAVDVERTGPEALRAALSFDYAAVLLDLLIPGLHGLAVLREVRKAKPRMPVLVLSALDRTEERVDGLDRGADDYLAKPFALEEMLARLRALVRRSALGAPDSVVRVQNLAIDLARRTVRRGDRLVTLTAREYSLLVFLVGRRNRPVTRAEIGEHVVDRAFEPASNAIDVSICGLRAKLGAPEVIRTVRGVGYCVDDSASP